jgi:hypothetical protein
LYPEFRRWRHERSLDATPEVYEEFLSWRLQKPRKGLRTYGAFCGSASDKCVRPGRSVFHGDGQPPVDTRRRRIAPTDVGESELFLDRITLPPQAVKDRGAWISGRILLRECKGKLALNPTIPEGDREDDRSRTPAATAESRSVPHSCDDRNPLAIT